MPLTLEPVLSLQPVRAKVNDKGRLVIPAPFREALGIKPGDVVFLELVDDQICVLTFDARLKRTQERLRQFVPPGVSMVDELIAERRREARKDEDEYQQWVQKTDVAGLDKPR